MVGKRLDTGGWLDANPGAELFYMSAQAFVEIDPQFFAFFSDVSLNLLSAWFIRIRNEHGILAALWINEDNATSKLIAVYANSISFFEFGSTIGVAFAYSLIEVYYSG
ncbi:hypothetical protein MASR1M36_04000 [Candidatus Cloacimonadaceae bacterium]|jgi:hypothetical protein